MSDGINTGMQRAVEFVVTKKINDEVAEGYPHTYSLKQAFGNYQEVTENQLAQMLIGDYKARLSAFKTYVESVDMGAVVDKESAYSENTGLCPLPEHKMINYITVTYYWTQDREWGDIIYKLTVQADKPVASDLTVTLTVHIVEQAGSTTVEVPLSKGASYYETDTWALNQHLSEFSKPGYDDTYEYQVRAIDVYE